MNYAHLVYGIQMASAAQAWMYRHPQEDWENFLSGVNGFLNQEEADMRNSVVHAMLFPCIDCLNQKKFAQQEIIFHHLSHVVLQNITRVGINMVRKALMNSKHAA
jgi:hypothetical protein